ncbi:hypothetical protein ACRAWF_35415 [Streptomyces sp. L7]
MSGARRGRRRTRETPGGRPARRAGRHPYRRPGRGEDRRAGARARRSDRCIPDDAAPPHAAVVAYTTKRARVPRCTSNSTTPCDIGERRVRGACGRHGSAGRRVGQQAGATRRPPSSVERLQSGNRHPRPTWE